MSQAVHLKLAHQSTSDGGGSAHFSVKVKNLGFGKEVSVLYTGDDQQWKAAPLEFAAHFGNYDLFTGQIHEPLSQFVVRYAIGGEVYYDNQFGENFRLGPPQAVVGDNVALQQATSRQGMRDERGLVVGTSWLEGEILVNHRSFIKTVGVLLSADGGANWVSTNATYASQTTSGGIDVGTNVEVWRFKTPDLRHDPSAVEFQFAVFYRDGGTGELFWDNSFGQNYSISKLDGACVE